MRIVGNPPSGGKKPTTPTIGTATDGGTGTTVSVAFTPSTYIGKGTITYTATSSPGSLTASGSGSPLTVSGLTTGQAYTFTVQGATNYGVNSDSSAASNSVTPASPSSFESIASISVASPTLSVTFSSIPQTYKHLQIRGIFMGDASSSQLRMKFNGSGSGYADHTILGNGTAVSATADTSATEMRFFSDYDSTQSTALGVTIIDIIDYTSTSKTKVARSCGGYDANGSGKIRLTSGLWNNTAAITSITLQLDGSVFNFTTATKFALYGIK